MPKKKKSLYYAPRPPRKVEGEWRLVLVDEGPIRRSLSKECQKLMQSVEEARAHVHRFQAVSSPEFERWKAATFGELLTRLRELRQAWDRAEDLVDEVEYYAMMEGVSLRRAYREVMEERELEAQEAAARAAKKQSGPEPGFDESGDDPHGSGPDMEQAARQAFEDVLRTFLGINPKKLPKHEYDEMFRGFRANFLGEDKAPPPPPRGGHSRREQPQPSSPPKKGTSRLKELYRALVRRLHPDMRADSNAQVSALWHEVQLAYQHGNEERLETLLAMSDMQADNISASTPVSQLHAIRKELKSNLAAIRRELNKIRKDIAWNFEQSDRARMQRRIQQQLDSEIAFVQEELTEMERMIERWKAAPPARKVSKKPAPKPTPKAKPKAKGKAKRQTYWQSDLPF